MTASDIGYAKVHGWVKEMLTSATHTTVIGTVAWVVLCLLVAQRITPAALARALPAAEAGSGRSRLRRIRRWWSGPALDPTTVTPRLISAALALLPPAPSIVIALDTTRVGGWEIWQAGVVFAGHTLPVAWAVLPYPWPKGKFRPVTLALIAQLQAGFGPGQRWVLVADRGFPNPELFAQLLRHQTDWTVRLRLSDWVAIQGVYAQVADHLDAGRLVAGESVAATLGTGAPSQPRVTAQLVVSAVLRCPRPTSAIRAPRGSAPSAPRSGPSIWRRRGAGASRPAPGRNATPTPGCCLRRQPRSKRRWRSTPNAWRSRRRFGTGITAGGCAPPPPLCPPRRWSPAWSAS